MLNKKKSYLRQGGNNCQQDSTLVTKINMTKFKKDRKIEKDLTKWSIIVVIKRVIIPRNI